MTAQLFGLPTVTRMGRDPHLLPELASGKLRGSVALARGQRDRAGRRLQAGGGPTAFLKSFDLSRPSEVPNSSSGKRHHDCPAARADFDVPAAHVQQLRPPRNNGERVTALDHSEALHGQVDGADMFADDAHAFDG